MSDDTLIERFARDGFALQRGAVGPEQLAALHRAVDECRRAPSAHHAVLGRVGDAVFDSDLFRWRDLEEIGSLIGTEPLVSQARRLLASPVLFVEDQWFSADPGSGTGSPWHQDGPYYEIDRGFVTCWIPLDDVAAEHSLHVIPGSHTDGTRLEAVAFDSDGDTIQAPDNDTHTGTAADVSTEPPASTFDTERAVSFDMRAGDALWFHAGTIHGVPRPAPNGGRRFSLRYAPADARRHVTGRTVAAFWNTLPHGLSDGDPLANSEWFPKLAAHDFPIPHERPRHAPQ